MVIALCESSGCLCGSSAQERGEAELVIWVSKKKNQEGE